MVDPGNILKPTIVSDIDGVLADVQHRLYLVPTSEIEASAAWQRFHLAMVDDEVVKPIRNLLRTYFMAGYEVVLATARPDTYQPQTLRWLRQHNVPFTKLMMRRWINGESKGVSAPQVKKRQLNELQAQGHRIELFLDDEQRNIKVGVDLGIPSLWVANGYGHDQRLLG